MEKIYQPFALLVLVLAVITGVFLVYRLNDSIDQHHDLKFNIRKFWGNPLHKVCIIQFVFILIPASLYFLSSFTFWVMAIAAVAGFIYSITLHINGKKFRIKNVFIVKNLFIGLAWGALVFIGAGGYSNPLTIAFFIFASVQVFIGSVIRDIPDFKKDIENNVKSLPVVLGIKNTIYGMKLLNITSVASVYFIEWDDNIMFVISAVIVWRLVNLRLLYKGENIKFWSQTFNLATCVLIYLGAVFLEFYG
ncbi:MAG: UbiA family prenyltransferase [Crocinitomicaceae bacterium]|nr:UbiA family prenyltransferase [Crocinitomicaceae bacterium]